MPWPTISRTARMPKPRPTKAGNDRSHRPRTFTKTTLAPATRGQARAAARPILTPRALARLGQRASTHQWGAARRGPLQFNFRATPRRPGQLPDRFAREAGVGGTVLPDHDDVVGIARPRAGHPLLVRAAVGGAGWIAIVPGDAGQAGWIGVVRHVVLRRDRRAPGARHTFSPRVGRRRSERLRRPLAVGPGIRLGRLERADGAITSCLVPNLAAVKAAQSRS
jgi:hypothetical protein